MKIRIDKEAFGDAVSWTSRALAGRGGGIGIGIEASGDKVVLTAFDSDTSARAEIDAVVEQARMHRRVCIRADRRDRHPGIRNARAVRQVHF